MADLKPAQARLLNALVDQQSAGRAAITEGARTGLLTSWRMFLLTGAESVRSRTQASAGGNVRNALAAKFALTAAQAALLYQERDVRSLGEQLADRALAAQRQAFNLQREFQRRYLAGLGVQAPALSAAEPVGRIGVDPAEVYLRPAETFRFERSTGTPVETALERAEERLLRLVEDDVMLATRDGAMDVLDNEELGVTTYRRLLRPELSETGVCGLCIVAADRTYYRGDLMALHGRCKCVVSAVVDGLDAAEELNTDELNRLYKAAGVASGGKRSTYAKDLKRVRVQVNENGELGPVLVRSGANTRTPEEIVARRRSVSKDTPASASGAPAREGSLLSDPAWLRGQLDQTTGRLDALEARAAAGEDVSGPLEYARSQAKRFRKLLASAG